MDSNTGKETFHLLASTVQLEKLEKLYNHPTMLKEKEAKNQSVQTILIEIKSLGRENLRAHAKRPQRVAGKLHGNSNGGFLIPSEFMGALSEITATRTYVKSETIDHK